MMLDDSIAVIRSEAEALMNRDKVFRESLAEACRTLDQAAAALEWSETALATAGIDPSEPKKALARICEFAERTKEKLTALSASVKP